MKKIIATTFVLGAVLLALITGCREDITLIIKPELAAITDTVSFSKELVPIFTKECALSGCHASGGHAPVLSADKAFSSLISGSYINTKSAENSIVYLRLTGGLSPAMPMGRASNPSNINALILAWIKQGATKN